MPPEMITAHVNGTGFAYDADLGWYWGMLPSKDAGIDEHGFREHNTPVSVAKPPGITGVITFGDSQTYGAGVRPDETWSAQAEAALGPGYEVLNAGLSGYRSLNVLRLIKLRAAAYSPDAVVIDCMPYDSPRDDGLTLGAPVGWQDPVRRLLWSSRIQSESSPLARPLGLTGGPAKPWQPRSDRGLGERGAACGSSSCNTPHMDNRSGRIRCQTGQGELPEGFPVVPACDALAADGRAPKALFLDNNHLTVEGNRVVGLSAAATIRAAFPSQNTPEPSTNPAP